ncbi:hypothetical protein MKY25_07360 [Geobacillus sp. FSL W8-0032]|uniref:YphA family membrane protein n=1 Tax=unclassified Geobacillus TaxID=2642459 RepID=UPI0030D761FD
MEGAYFYVGCWLLWLVATFFMKKTPERTALAAFALLMISSASLELKIGPMRAALSFFVLLFASCYGMVKQRPCSSLLMVWSTSGVAFAYAALRLLALFDPVWIWLDERWLLAWWLAIVSALFHRRLFARLVCVAMGGCQGEVVYALAIDRMAPDYVIGSFSFLDALAISVASLLVWEMIRFFAFQLEEKRPIRRTRQP